MLTPETIVEAWMSRVWNKMETGAIDELLALTAEVHGIGAAPLIGPAGFKEFHAGIDAAFSDIRVTIGDQVVNGDKVATRFSVDMTQRATGKQVSIASMAILVCRNGQIQESWNCVDFLPMLVQLGTVPADAVERSMLAPAA